MFLTKKKKRSDKELGQQKSNIPASDPILAGIPDEKRANQEEVYIPSVQTRVPSRGLFAEMGFLATEEVEH